MFKNMTGNTAVLEEIKVTQVGIENTRSQVISTQDENFKEMKSYFSTLMVGGLEAMERRLLVQFEEQVEMIKETVSNPKNIISAIDKREDDAARSEARESIKNNLSRIYAKEKEVSLFEEAAKGVRKLTRDGESLYRLLSETIIAISKYHGSNSHMKVANRTTYGKFQKYYKLAELTKKTIIFSCGKSRESVYADIIYRGVLGKFARFLEDEFIDEKETIL